MEHNIVQKWAHTYMASWFQLKNVKKNSIGKDNIFQQMVPGQLDSHIEKNEVELISQTILKN